MKDRKSEKEKERREKHSIKFYKYPIAFFFTFLRILLFTFLVTQQN